MKGKPRPGRGFLIPMGGVAASGTAKSSWLKGSVAYSIPLLITWVAHQTHSLVEPVNIITNHTPAVAVASQGLSLRAEVWAIVNTA